MDNPEAARLADTLRAAMKSQNLNGSDLADEYERLTGVRPHPMQVSRWLRGERPLIRVSPDLAVIARVLRLDPVELVVDTVRQTQLVPDDRPAAPVRTPVPTGCDGDPCTILHHHLPDDALPDANERALQRGLGS